MGVERFHCAACAASFSGFGLFMVSVFSGNSALKQGVRANRQDVLSWIRSYLSAVAPLDRSVSDVLVVPRRGLVMLPEVREGLL